LAPSDQKRVRGAIDQLVEGDITRGLRPHPVGDFMSFSASMDIRILAVTEPDGLVLVHVDHHDEAYRWGERHGALLGHDDRLLAVLPADNDIHRTTRPSQRNSMTQSKFAGLPRAVAAVLDSATTDEELLEVIAALSPEWQEVALAVVGDSEAFVVPSDIVAVDDELLQFALSLPAEKWRVFLHPTQRAVVDLPASRNLLLRGGPGTGKTVCLVHRFVRLAALNPDRPPVLVSLNAPAREALELACRSLGHDPQPGTIIDFADLDRRLGFKQLSDKTSAILIDEGQDLPVGVIARLLENLERSEPLPMLTIAFDPNQAIVEPSGDAMERLQPFSDTVTLTYCYRMTSEILSYSSAVLERLHNGFTGRRFQDQHHIEARRDSKSAQMTAVVTGPEVKEVLVGQTELLARVVQEAEETRTEAGTWEGIGVVVVGDAEQLIEQLETHGIPAFRPADVKGLEFFRGIILDNLPSPQSDNAPIPTTAAGYRAQSGLYVAMTRFRDQVTLFTPHANRAFRKSQ
jgi:hypothetical protein